jgi:hypothetical protein
VDRLSGADLPVHGWNVGTTGDDHDDWVQHYDHSENDHHHDANNDDAGTA